MRTLGAAHNVTLKTQVPLVKYPLSGLPVIQRILMTQYIVYDSAHFFHGIFFVNSKSGYLPKITKKPINDDAREQQAGFLKQLVNSDNIYKWGLCNQNEYDFGRDQLNADNNIAILDPCQSIGPSVSPLVRPLVRWFVRQSVGPIFVFFHFFA